MKLYKREQKYVSVLTVWISSAAAAIDMMRYDRCVPKTEVDSAKIERLMQGRGHKAGPEDHIVQFYHYADVAQPATRGRWKSFNCHVLDERAPDAHPISPDEARAFLGAVLRASKTWPGVAK